MTHPTHYQHMTQANLERDCNTRDILPDGRCLNCYYNPRPPTGRDTVREYIDKMAAHGVTITLVP